jgi:8-oxo-dGTP pyrophosphatase MutT (NUDIX family)
MDKPVFNNRPNEHVTIRHETEKTTTVTDYWIGRAVAVVSVVFAVTVPALGMQVLVTKRSKRMRDEAGKMGLPCGYLDWDENCYEAVIRETYEETSLYLPDYKDLLITNNNEKPFTIHDSPSRDARQNVSHIYLSVYDFHNRMEMFPTGVEKYSDHETEFVKWITLSDFYNKYENGFEWAFRHNETLKEAVKFLNLDHNPQIHSCFVV